MESVKKTIANMKISRFGRYVDGDKKVDQQGCKMKANNENTDTQVLQIYAGIKPKKSKAHKTSLKDNVRTIVKKGRILGEMSKMFYNYEEHNLDHEEPEY